MTHYYYCGIRYHEYPPPSPFFTDMAMFYPLGMRGVVACYSGYVVHGISAAVRPLSHQTPGL